MKIFRDKISDMNYNEEDSVLHIKIIKNAHLNLDNIIEHFESIKELTGNKKYVALVDTVNYFKMQPEAFMHSSLEKVNNNRIATAFYNPNIANKVTINFFKHYFKPTIPTEMFGSITEALAWLNDIKSQSLIK